MLSGFMKKIFGSSNDRYLKKLKPLVAAINAKEAEFEKLKDPELQAQTDKFKERLSAGETLDDILVDAFAVVREASKRTLGMRPFDVQLMGGIILHRGMISEMMTGEGKTLMATLPTYLNALTGKGVHIVTVNDYLAQRDSEWMGAIYKFLGLSVDCILNAMDDQERQNAYNADITYGTNNEFGFDYLRDNMKFRREEMVQRPFNYGIVDEVDSILIDEARTPLIISGPAEDSSELYQRVDAIIPKFTPEDYEKDEKARAVTLTEAGSEKVEKMLEEQGLLQKGSSLYDVNNISLVHHVNQALKAHTLFTRDVDYIVKDRKVIIIDEFTGRMMEGRRYSEGLHQALEAKENAEIQVENQTLASITFQNYFRLYPKLSGMTGTAVTEAAEFGDIYSLEVVQVPTNLPLVREDSDDEVYRTSREKYDAISDLIAECQKRGQPVLVGTTSIEKSEYISQLLTKKKVEHNVLNARYHEQEAHIIAQAGKPGAVTVATNMAGRGTDIKLGGNAEMLLEQATVDIEDPKKIDALKKKIEKEVAEAQEAVKKAGGLYIIGTERHESRRIDNQLRGRAGRQGDPGKSKFFLSLEDDLMRIFGSERLDAMLQKLGLEEGEAIIHPWVNKALERAQQKVEARNFEIRKNLLKYDDVMNDQRKVTYGQRRDLMEEDDASEAVQEMRDEVIDEMISRFIPENAYPEQWDVSALHEECVRLLGLDLPIKAWSEEEGIADVEIKQRVTDAIEAKIRDKESRYGAELMRIAEKSILLRILDQSWKDHLLSLDHLRQGINLRAYGQRDPLNEYKREAFTMFQEMLGRVREMTVAALSHLELRDETQEEIQEAVFEGPEASQKNMVMQRPDFMEEGEEAEGDQKPVVKATASIAQRLSKAKGKPKTKVDSGKDSKGAKGKASKTSKKDTVEEPESRNAPCPCGSGKRYKHCHGEI